MKNSNDTIGNRTRDLPACSAVPQPTVSTRALTNYETCSLLQNNMALFSFELLNNTVSISDYTESLFYLTNITCRFLPVDRRAYGRAT